MAVAVEYSESVDGWNGGTVKDKKVSKLKVEVAWPKICGGAHLLGIDTW